MLRLRPFEAVIRPLVGKLDPFGHCDVAHTEAKVSNLLNPK